MANVQYASFLEEQGRSLDCLALMLTADAGLAELCLREALLSGIDDTGRVVLNEGELRFQVIQAAVRMESTSLQSTSIDLNGIGAAMAPLLDFRVITDDLPKLNLDRLIEAVVSLDAFPRFAFILRYCEQMDLYAVSTLLRQSVGRVKAGCVRAAIGITQFAYRHCVVANYRAGGSIKTEKQKGSMQHLKSLRDYLKALEAIGELQPINQEVDLMYEIGAISRRAYETGSAAPLFNRIKGIGLGFRVLGAPAGVSRQPGLYLSRIAVSLGLEPKASARQIIDELVAARDRPGIKPVVVSNAPCKQNIHLGSDIDLEKLPAPWLHDGDGGRFLNTYGIIVAQTPDKSWTNWSIARIMIVDRTHMAGIVAPFQHIGIIHKMWADQGKDMPFALALGVEPFLPFVGGMPLPAHFDEADYVGGYFGEAVEVTPAETVELMVPATAEIVVEGHLSATGKAPEGPMGEYAGYLWNSGPLPKPMYTVTAITHQDNAILPVSVAGEPPEENHTAWGVPNAAEIVYELRKAGIPVATAWSPFESANHWYVIALDLDWQPKTHLTAEKICRRIGEILFSSKAGAGTPKYLVVNDDVDVSNTKEVVWAFATRNYPGELGEVIFHGESTNPLVSFLHDSEKMSMETTKVVYNCLPPEEWKGKLPKRSSFSGAFSQELQKKVLDSWPAYGYAPLK